MSVAVPDMPDTNFASIRREGLEARLRGSRTHW